MGYLPYIVAAWLCLAGLWGIATSRNLLHMIVCLSVMQSSTYLLLLTIGYRRGARAPILSDRDASAPTVDPVVQALTLTDIVVGATVMALLLAVAIQVHKQRGSLDPNRLRSMRG
jgi:multicomponent Na+:H+ antiporter subunit C